jgi:hypothetical protein
MPTADNLLFRVAVARLAGFLASALVIAPLFGCASAPPKERSVLVGSAAQNLLILPFNVTAIMPPELKAMSPFVWAELEVYLREHGKQLKTASFRDARRLWLSSIRQVRSGEKGARAGFDDAARVLVLELAKHAEFDTVIVPSLFIRKARISGSSATWDGVERALEFAENRRDARSMLANTPLVGEAPAASLHAVVLDAEGNKIQEAKGGLELLVLVRVSGGLDYPTSIPTLEFATRTDLFANREHVREGIAEALAPFLPPFPLNAK